MSRKEDLSDQTNTDVDRGFQRVLSGLALSTSGAETLMGAIIEGDISELRIAALLAALEIRGPAPEELAGFHSALSTRMVPVPNVPAGAIDTCGTGGSGLPTLNTSTLSGLVAAASGAVVAKHGNRSASGRCGSLDVLEALGAKIDLEPATTSVLLKRHRFAFVNARSHHPALGRLAALRKSLGFRTVFNLLGPILSPARVRRQLLGVSDPRVAPSLANALAQLGHERAWVVSGPGGLDEVALTDTTAVWEVKEGRVHRFALDPKALGLPPASFSELSGGTVDENSRRFEAILSGQDRGPAKDHVAINAAAALVIAGVASSLSEGLERARACLEDGTAYEGFAAWRADTQAAGAGSNLLQDEGRANT